MHRTLPLACLTAVLAGPAAAGAAVTVEQVISREHAAFDNRSAQLTVGRDGLVYLAGNTTQSLVLRLRRDGKDRFAAQVLWPVANATANVDGIVATANDHFSHQVHLYDQSLSSTVGVL